MWQELVRGIQSFYLGSGQYELKTSVHGATKSYWSYIQFGNGYCEGLFGGGGTSANPITSATAGKHYSFRGETTATSGDNRLFYLRFYLTGDGSTTGGGECLRAFTTVNDAEVGTAHGAHISLNFGSTGTLTGLGVAMRATLHLPNATPVGGTLAPIQAEIWSDGASSDPAGSTVSFIRVVNDGNASGKADVEDDVPLFDLVGFTSDAAHLWYDNQGAAPANIEEWVKWRTPAGIRWMPLYNAVV